MTLSALEDLLGLDLDVGDLAADLAVGLMDHDLGVRQGEPPPFAPPASKTAAPEAAMPMQ